MVLESFENYLIHPESYKVLTHEEAKNIEFSSKITNKKFLNGDYADLINFGLFIVKKDGTPEFASRCQYVFKDDKGKSDIKLVVFNPEDDSISKERMSVREMIEKGKLSSYGVNNIDELIKLDKEAGTITFTGKFTSIPEFNMAYDKVGTPLKLTTGVYQWDITDPGNNHFSLYDDEPIQFIKSLTNDGFHFRTHSQGNLMTSSVNGKFEFIVK